MTVTAVILLTISALTHAGWNLFSKADQPSSASFLLANCFGTLLVFPLLVVDISQTLAMLHQLWPLLIATGFFQALYFTGLAFAYQKGELTIAYPLARSLPSLIVLLVVCITGNGTMIGIPAFIGVFLIMIGGFLLPLESFGNYSFRNYKNIAIASAIVAAAGTAGYSMVDDYALTLVARNQSVSINDRVMLACYYLGLQGMCTIIWQLMVVAFDQNERQLLKNKVLEPLSSMVKGAGIFVTYFLVLISMGYVTNISYVVAFRQLSIPIGLVFGLLFLKEQAFIPKIIAVFLLFTGVILVGLD